MFETKNSDGCQEAMMRDVARREWDDVAIREPFKENVVLRVRHMLLKATHAWDLLKPEISADGIKARANRENCTLVYKEIASYKEKT
jgi:hypothetical protein